MARYERREFLKGMTIGAACLAGVPRISRAVRAAESEKARPNVLVLQPDQHRGTVMRCAGDEQVRTPNLDRLAAEGIRFSNCLSAGPVCSPFRGTLQTGLHCYQHGVVRNNIRLDLNLTTFAEIFAEAGYATGYIGKWHLDGGLPGGGGKSRGQVKDLGFVPEKNRQGWQEWHGHEKGHQYFTVAKFNEKGKPVRVEGYDWEPTWQTDVALDFIRRNHKAGKPWLYYLAYGPPHLPRECPRKYLEMYPPEAFVFPPDVERNLPVRMHDALRKELQVYYGQVAAVDAAVGRLLEGLKKIGADANTIVLYTSDHGDLLGSHYDRTGRLRGKGTAYASALRIPLIVRWPAKIAPGQVCDAPVSSVDLTPTILGLAGFEAPRHMPGHSMAGWCLEGRGYWNDVLYLGLGDGKPVGKGAIEPAAGKRVKAAGIRKSGAWRAAWDGRYLYQPGALFGNGAGWLYDHERDPYEMTDLINSPDHLGVKKRLAAAMLEIAHATDDPVLPALRRLFDNKGLL